MGASVREAGSGAITSRDGAMIFRGDGDIRGQMRGPLHRTAKEMDHRRPMETYYQKECVTVEYKQQRGLALGDATTRLSSA